MQTVILQSASESLQAFIDLSCNYTNNTLEVLKKKDVNMIELFQQKLFAKLVNNSGNAETAF